MEGKGIILSMVGRVKEICDECGVYLKESGRDVKLVKGWLKMDKVGEVLKGIDEEGERCLMFTEYIEMGK
ncbi:hypothetical protein, partial [Bacillus sp. WP8]|uniref:hypothetical protein n=1 Tax=Bacillus sp. WP8 TaxID=756828 RepID=UPI001C92CBFE